MKQLTISSERYPGLGAPVPQVPGAAPGTKGSFTFAVGVPYEVTDETAQAVKDLHDLMEIRVSRHFRLTIADLTPDVVAAGAIAVPDLAPTKPDEPLVLTDDDQDLIEVEVAKLKGLTVAAAIPIVENTAMNDELPVEVRRAYLQAVIETRNAKAIDKRAAELLELLAD